MFTNYNPNVISNEKQYNQVVQFLVFHCIYELQTKYYLEKINKQLSRYL